MDYVKCVCMCMPQQLLRLITTGLKPLYQINCRISPFGGGGGGGGGERLRSADCWTVESVEQFLRRVLISFIWGKLSTEAVVLGIVRLILASTFKFGNILFSMSLTASSSL